MKKKVMCLLLGVSMMLGLAACGAGGGSASNVLTLKWDGDKYDLFGDFQKVVGKMVEDGHVVVNPMLTLGVSYDEDGCYAGSVKKMMMSGELDEGLCYAYESPIDRSLQRTAIIQSYYQIGVHEEEYETADGITGESSQSDIKDLDEYVKVRPLRGGDSAYAALYVDGKCVDLEEYEDTMDDYLEMMNEEGGIVKATKEVFSQPVIGLFQFIVPMQGSTTLALEPLTASDYRELIREGQSEWGAENMLQMALAAQEASKALEDEDIKSYSIIFYECFDGDEGDNMVHTTIYNYTYDEDYDIRKFEHKK